MGDASVFVSEASGIVNDPQPKGRIWVLRTCVPAYRYGFSSFAGRFVTEALVRFLFLTGRRQPGAATGVFGLFAS